MTETVGQLMDALRANRAARRTSVCASDKCYRLLDHIDELDGGLRLVTGLRDAAYVKIGQLTAKLEDMTAQRDRLHDHLNTRPTGTADRREFVRTQRMEAAEARVKELEADLEQLKAVRGADGCDHFHWDFAKHGRRCPCGALMVDPGD